jgi:hypothetical protein
MLIDGLDEGPTRLLHQPPFITLTNCTPPPREMFSRPTPPFARETGNRQSVVMPMRKGYGEVRAQPGPCTLSRPPSMIERRTVSEPAVTKGDEKQPRKTIRKQMSFKRLFYPAFSSDQPVPGRKLLPAAEINEASPEPAPTKSLVKRFSISNLSNSFKRRGSSPEQQLPPIPCQTPLVDSPESITSPTLPSPSPSEDCESLYSFDYKRSLSLNGFLAFDGEPEPEAQIRQVVVRRPERAMYFVARAGPGSKSSLDTDDSEPQLATPVSVLHKWAVQRDKSDFDADAEADADLRGLGLEFDEWQDRLPICKSLHVQSHSH